MLADAGDTALIVLAAFWAVLVLVLCVVLIGTYNVLTSTKLTIDAMREETVPLLREIKTSVEKTNRRSTASTRSRVRRTIVGRVDRISGLVEEAASSPIVKLISLGAGIRKGIQKATEKKG